MKNVLIAIALMMSITAFAQTKEELLAKQAPKKDSIAKLQGEVDAIQAQIDALPGWRTGAFGTIGANIAGYDKWYSRGTPNTSTGNIGITVNGFANLIQEKYFWRNSANVNLAWVKNDDKDNPDDSDSFDSASDVFTITSLYGWKLSDTWAISALGEYRTTIIENFNDPGYLDLGVGATWTPVQDLVVVIHPLNYNFVFADNDTAFDSSTGAKIVADYTRQLGKVNFKTNFTTFQSYKDGDLSNWTWINSFGYTFWKGIGLGFEFGLRGNQQEVLSDALNPASPRFNANASFDNIDNEVQSYWLFGLNYSF